MADQEKVKEKAPASAEVEAPGEETEVNADFATVAGRATSAEREEVEPARSDDRAELLRRAVFAEEALELSRYVGDKDLLQRLRGVIGGQSEVELKEKLSVLKEVLAHIKESQGRERPTEEGLKEMVASEVHRNLDRLSNAAETVDAAVGQSPGESGPAAKDSAAARVRRLARVRGILIK